MAPQIGALRAHSLKFYTGIDTYNQPADYTVTSTGAVIGYGSGPGGLPSGYTDRIYVHDVSVTLDNYTQAIEAGSVTDSAATSVTLTGLAPNRLYRIGCVRFDSNGTATDISNEELLKTWQDAIEVTPPNLSKQIDWSVDKFSDWITGSFRPWDNSQQFYSLHKYSDAVMGSYVQVTYRDIKHGVNAQEETVEIIFDLSGFEGVKALSPRHDWRIDIPLRTPAPNTSLQNNWQLDQSGGLYQMETGISSGDQCEVLVCHNAAHNVYVGKTSEMAGNFSDLSTAPTLDGTSVWATRYGNIDGELAAFAATAWSMTNSASSPLAPGRRMQFLQRNVFSFRYTASERKLRVYLDDVLHTVMGTEHNLPIYRKKFPHDHYDFPIQFKMKFQCLSNYYSNPESQFIDIGDVLFQTASPMHYAGWSAKQAGSQASQYGYKDGYSGFDNYNPAKHTLTGLCYVGNNTPITRFTSTLHSGYTVPFLPSTAFYSSLPVQELDYDMLLPQPWNSNTPPPFSTALHTAKTLPVEVPSGTRVAYVVFHGFRQYGTLRARIIDQDGVPILNYVTVDTVTNAPIIEVPENTATRAQIEVEIQYDGSAIDYTTQYVSSDPPSTEAVKPSSPSLFVGYEMYFADPADIPPMEMSDATAPTITFFNVPSTSSSLTVAVITEAMDNVAVTGYKLTESATSPLAGDAGWSATAPTEYTFASAGSKTLYAWAKDAAGNVSTGVGDTVVITLPVSNQPPTFTSQPAVQSTTTDGAVLTYGTSDNESNHYRLDLSTNNGTSWTTIVADETPGTGKTYTVTGLVAGSYQVKLRITALTGDITPVVSNAVTVTVAEPVELPPISANQVRMYASSGGGVRIKCSDGVVIQLAKRTTGRTRIMTAQGVVYID